MRVLALRLIAYGPFTGEELDFSGEAPGLHLVYGRNEAGKSTALRALTAVLFGVEETTPDAHRHARPDLRIGARLDLGEGQELEVVRRKGRVRTLLDPGGNPVDEGPLRGALGGIGRELFLGAFGLDHQSLRAGAERLLLGHGELGESLFDAGLGGPGVRGVLEALNQEAEELFAPRAERRPINEAIKRHRDASQRCREASRSGEAYLEQQAKIGAAIAERAQRREVLADLRRELLDGERLLRVLPLLARLEASRRARADLGEVARILPAAMARHDELVREASRLERERDRIEGERSGIGQELATLRAPEALLAVSVEDAEELAHRLRDARAAALELPRQRARLETLPGTGEERSRSAPADARLEHRLAELSVAHGGLVERLEGARRAAAAEEGEHEALRERVEALPAASASASASVARLERALQAARLLGDPDALVEAAEQARDERAEEARAALAGLTRFAGSLDQAVRLALPEEELVDRVAAALPLFAAERERLEAALADARRERREAEDEVRDLVAQGPLPSEAELSAARQRRDLGLGLVLRALREGKAISRAALRRFAPEQPLDVALTGAVKDADEVADRLRKEQARVLGLAELEGRKDRAGRLADQARKALAGVEERRLAVEDEWNEAWRPAGIDPASPAAMKGWLRCHARLVELASRLRQAEAEATRVRGRRDAGLAELALALAAVPAHAAGTKAPAAGADGAGAIGAAAAGSEATASLGAWVDRAAGVLAEAATHQRERVELKQALAERQRALRAARAEVEARERALTEWRQAWDECTAALGLGVVAPERAQALLLDRAEARRRSEQREAVLEEVRGLEHRIEELTFDIARRVAEHAPDLHGLAADRTGEELVRRYRQARVEAERRERLAADLEALRRKGLEAAAASARAAAELDGLIRAAGAVDRPGLLAAEEASRRAAELERELAELSSQVLAMGDGKDLDELARQARGAEATSLRLAMEERRSEIEAAEEDLRHRDQEIGGLQSGLEQWFDEGDAAAVAASDASAAAAALDRLVSSYVVARIGAAVLRREVDRYRDSHQGPVLTRANELFPRLTLGEYTRLKVEASDDDLPVLRAVRRDGSSVGVEGLSDGTRDQLYLALRLASVERHFATVKPLPFVLDDALMTFDDPRAEAALQVLGELGRRAQVIYFTHHEHILALARKAVPAGVLVEHTLERPATERLDRMA